MNVFLAYYIIFQSYVPPPDPEEEEVLEHNPMSSPAESFLRVFIMSLGIFGDVWDSLDFTNHAVAGKARTFAFT